MKQIIRIVFFAFFSLVTLSKEFKVGDEIKLKISNINEESAKKIFKEQSIEKISTEDKETKIIFRDWKKGKKTIMINEKKFPIEIKSNILPEEKEIFLDYSKGSIVKIKRERIPYLFMVGSIILICGLILLLISSKKERKETPEEIYQKQINNLTENYLFEASYCLREYIDTIYKTNFLNGYYKEIDVLEARDILFIKELDYKKFSTIDNSVSNPASNIKQNNKEKLKEAVEEIVAKIKQSTLEDEVKKNV